MPLRGADLPVGWLAGIHVRHAGTTQNGGGAVPSKGSAGGGALVIIRAEAARTPGLQA